MLSQKVIYVKLLSLSKEHIILLKTKLLLKRYKLKGLQRKELKLLGISQCFNSFFIYTLDKSNINLYKVLEDLETNNFLQILGIIENNILIQVKQQEYTNVYILNICLFVFKLFNLLVSKVKLKLIQHSNFFYKEYVFLLNIVSFENFITFYKN